ncbi:NAD(P)(+)--arginine ADP-ribosyltransferase 1-like [Sardina pilchardus]|uniref:NAD(P)(+)--arginine ADP-ribosyltransferase 1-like n=1 Tax=Sardina pilchardus TaxID=27697 RepID=UPI002E1359F8
MMMKMASPVLNLIFTVGVALGQDERKAAAGHVFPLDMAVGSVDDQYQGCRERMAELVKIEFLPRELNNTTVFGKAWSKILEKKLHHCDNDVLPRNHCIALYVYTGDDAYRAFNKADRMGKHNYTNGTYGWYSLQFYLADAVQVLKGKHNNCNITYRGTDLTFDKNVLNKEVRFGSFTSSSFVPEKTQTFGTKSCFQIKTCYGAAIHNYSIYDEKEVLIPPYEKFMVTDVLKRSKHCELWCDTVYVLNSTGIRSDLNCVVAPTPVPTASGQSPPLHRSDQSLWVTSLGVITFIQTVTH